MKRILLALVVLIAATLGARSQTTVTVVGPITPGDCVKFNSTTVLADNGTTCNQGGIVIPGGVNGSIQYNNAGSFGGYTLPQLTALLSVFTSTLQGVVPASGGGTVNFLRADGTWAVPAASFVSVGSNLNASIAGYGATPITAYVTGTSNLTANLTVPANVTLVFQQGGCITQTGAFTLALNGPVQSAATQIFCGFSSGQISLSNFQPALPEWWGALGNNSHDDYPAIQSAISAYPSGGGTVQFRLASYLVTSGTPTITKSYMTLQCAPQIWRQLAFPTIVSGSTTAPALSLLGTTAGGNADGTLENTTINGCYFSRSAMGAASSFTITATNTLFTTIRNGGWSLSTVGLYIKNANSFFIDDDNGSIGGDLASATMYGIEVDGTSQGSSGLHLNNYVFFGSSSPTAAAVYAFYDLATAVGASTGDITINGFVVSGNTQYGIWIQDGGTFGANLQIYNTVMDSITNTGIGLYSAGNSATGSQEAAISGAWINLANASGSADGVLVVGRGATGLHNISIANSGTTSNTGISIEGAKYGTMSDVTLGGTVGYSSALRLITSGAVRSDFWTVSNVNVMINSAININGASQCTFVGIVDPVGTFTFFSGSNNNKLLGIFSAVTNSGTGNTVY